MTAHKKLVLAILLFAVIGMIGLSTAVQGGVSNSPALNYTAAGVEPNPQLNVNATWSNFYSSWKTLEYNNGTANQTLATNMSTFYKNPITVNPTDIKSKALQNEKIGTSSFIWENTSGYSNHSTTNDSSYAKITSGNGTLAISGNTSPEAGTDAQFGTYIQIANYPSNNLQYDYITIIYGLSGTAITGVNGDITLWNSTGHGQQIGSTIYPGEVGYISENLAQFQKDNGYSTTFNTTGTGTSTYMEIDPTLNMPESTTTEDYTLTIYGLAFTSYPMTLGTNSTGSVVSQSTGNAQLSRFAPSFPYTEVINNGYSVAVSQSLQNATISQSSINDGPYIEEGTYQGTLQMPSAPDLEYRNANITMPVALPGTQYKVLNVNGQSYTNTVSTMKNGTFSAGTVNPINANSVIVEAYYTSAEWDKVSSPPGFFSDPIGTIEYYWYIALGVALGAIGLGAGMKGRSSSFRQMKR